MGIQNLMIFGMKTANSFGMHIKIRLIKKNRNIPKEKKQCYKFSIRYIEKFNNELFRLKF